MQYYDAMQCSDAILRCNIAMQYCSAVIGNSSSGIIEAASFRAPVINIGNRQKGREQSANILNCDNDKDAIAKAIYTVQDEEFLAKVKNAENIYGQGNAANKIINTLQSVSLKNLVIKPFYLTGDQ